ncbi:hypothetical protein BKA70DRAFT_1501351 [Coprinopsis sp. MPI-PUGE-AT-0042]|nr:hypothetical protein BKA70DRAFT_1501351 [Coprinopsis sp. MPI-PUGE-AT-0042]
MPKTKLSPEERAAEKEQELRRDPLCEVLSGREVHCRLCGGNFKLSPKLMFDLDHWKRHRGRCVKRHGSNTPALHSRRKSRKSNTPSSSPDTIHDQKAPLEPSSDALSCIYERVLTPPPSTPPASQISHSSPGQRVGHQEIHLAGPGEAVGGYHHANRDHKRLSTMSNGNETTDQAQGCSPNPPSGERANYSHEDLAIALIMIEMRKTKL